MPNVSKTKLELIRKIVNARLTKDELQAITEKAHELIRRHTNETSEGNEINLYEQTDTDGIIKEALSNQ